VGVYVFVVLEKWGKIVPVDETGLLMLRFRWWRSLYIFRNRWRLFLAQSFLHHDELIFRGNEKKN
jgi:hypothetical protein